MTKLKSKTIFERFANTSTRFTGRPMAFIVAFMVVLLWAVTGPIFNFSDTWQLVINTGTTIVTFLMVFLIQQTQNKDSAAIHLKLNEIVAALKGASNRLINVQDLSEREIQTLLKFYQDLSEMAKEDNEIAISHTVEEAVENQEEKMKSRLEGKD
ncbi:low affinity iron permease family protein [Rhodocytophaga aerolata]|uniref:Low affinity iron permease family protein n=1 Tax=Rhodocytophaga aerolata TaxID=455078 RepID=A0ABT8R1K7_9BACT|nr:low affinity iron permease family protein [Rhodocytophaga aerolata]MDO1445193.1 low affinity iron permease family protein [Rhodocytophaga aerolata]